MLIEPYSNIKINRNNIYTVTVEVKIYLKWNNPHEYKHNKLTFHLTLVFSKPSKMNVLSYTPDQASQIHSLLAT